MTRLSVLAALVVAVPVCAKKPHIALILADDYGWANVGYHNAYSKEVVTPNLDRLAEQGVKLDRHYTYKFCSPTRSSLQTGRLPVHVNDQNAEPTLRNENDTIGGYAGIPVNMTGIAQKLRSAGYRAHMTGKWDAGMATPRHTPLGRGYESWLGYFHHSNDYWKRSLPFTATGTVDVCENQYLDLFYNDGPALHCANTSVYEEEYFLNNTLTVIRDHDVSEPLFLFHAFHLMHTPLEVPQKYLDEFDFITDSDSQRKPYAAMVKYMDDNIGVIVDALKAKGMWDDLLLIFLSDNGGPMYYLGGANNWPLKGGKMSDWEGGVRVNAFVSGGFIPENVRNTTVDSYVHSADWYTTLCGIAGVDHTDAEAVAAGLPAVDGKDIWADVIQTASQPTRTQIHLSSDALIDGRLKIVTGTQGMSMWTPQVYPREGMPQPLQVVPGPSKIKQLDHWPQDCTLGCLYDIIADPNERYNMAAEKPEDLARMMALLAELNKTNYEPNRGSGDKTACTVAASKYSGYYGPFVGI